MKKRRPAEFQYDRRGSTKVCLGMPRSDLRAQLDSSSQLEIEDLRLSSAIQAIRVKIDEESV